MTFPTPLMLALSAAVLTIDPSIPRPNQGGASSLEESSEHWMAVASYAEAFPKALAKRVGVVGALSRSESMASIDGLGIKIAGEALRMKTALAGG